MISYIKYSNIYLIINFLNKTKFILLELKNILKVIRFIHTKYSIIKTRQLYKRWNYPLNVYVLSP